MARKQAVAKHKRVVQKRLVGSSPDSTIVSEVSFPVVGIGASAGGLEAISRLLRHLPKQTGMAFVYIQHLDPHAQSNLPEILARGTEMPVVKVSDGISIQPDTVYVIAPNTLIQMHEGQLRVTPRDLGLKGAVLPVDHFLNSLAHERKGSAVGVILSGLGADGASGVRAIHADGGIVLAQTTSSAAFADMPQNAAETGCVDLILSPEELGQELARISQMLLAMAPKKIGDLFDHNQLIERILVHVRKQFGVNFSQYKQTTVRRRIHRRMVVHRFDRLETYLDYVKTHPEEVTALYNDLLINVTNFFRDPETFEGLKKEVFPKIVRRNLIGQPIRVWVPGCSTGEEAYSVAMALVEFLGEEAISSNIHVFATDVSERAIQKAREGMFGSDIASHVSAERLRRFFIKTDHGYQISKAIRDMCVFAVHNILSDPPFSKLDLVTCRNLLIYFGPGLQERVIPLLHYSLKPGGFLMLGGAESVGRYSDLFECVDSKLKIYSKKSTQKQHHFERPIGLGRDTIQVNEREVLPLAHSEKEIVERVEGFLLNRFVPPGFVINKDMDILQIRGDTSPYVQFTPGVPSHNLQKVLRPELKSTLRTLMHKVVTTKKMQGKEGIRIKDGAGSRVVQFQILPVKMPLAEQTYFAVLFLEAPISDLKKRNSGGRQLERVGRKKGFDGEVLRLEQELAETKDHLQEIIEEQEATNEELKSSNEELLSSNEELQSTNEELQTAKEEVQSANEELTTLNEELQNRNVEIAKVNNDLNNVLLSTRIPIVILGPDLCIRRFTPPATKLLRLIPTDIGRPIRDIRPSFGLPNLDNLVAEVIDTMQPQIQEVADEDGHWYSIQIHPYRTSDNKIDGAVIAFVDIHELKLGYERDRLLATVVLNSNDAITVQDLNGKIISWNRGAELMYGYSESEALKMNVYETIPEDKRDESKKYVQKIRNGDVIPSFDTQRIAKNGKVVEVWMTVAAITDDGGKVKLITTTERDITERKHSAQKFRALLESAPTAMVIVNDKREIVLVNTRAENLFGYEQNELLGKPLERLIPHRFREMHSRHFSDYQRHPTLERVGRDRDFFGLSKDGREFPVEIELSPIETAEGLLVASSVIDISERKHTEKVLRDARVTADSANQAKTNFLANMSHEIRTPLTAIIGFSELLTGLGATENQRLDYARRIRKNGQHLKQLVDDILDLTRIEAGKTELEHVEFPFVGEVGEIFATFRNQAVAKGLEFQGEFAEGVPYVIVSDPTRVRQILLNIIGNAVKFTTQGRVEVLVRLTSQAAGEAPKIEFTVKDTGCGVPLELQSKLFEPFVQADSSTTRRFGGTGLGLVLSRKLARALGGDVVLRHSSPGQGSTFVITMTPESVVHSSMVADREPPRQVRSDELLIGYREKFAGLKVLVAEDDQELQELLGNVLKILGLQVVFALDGNETVAKAKAENFALVFMDIQMPGLDGYEATRQIRQSGLKIPIVALTARLMRSEKQKCMEVGCNDCIAKPYSFDEIVAVLERYLTK